MRTIKSDGRYKLHGSGFHYIVEFRWRGLTDRKLFSDIIDGLTETYGPSKYYDEDTNRYVMNADWRYEANAKAKRRRIYLKDDASLSFILLKAGVPNGV